MPPTPKIPKGKINATNKKVATGSKNSAIKSYSKSKGFDVKNLTDKEKAFRDVAKGGNNSAIDKYAKSKGFNPNQLNDREKIFRDVAKGGQKDAITSYVEGKADEDSKLQKRENELTDNQKNEYYKIKAQMRRKLANDFGDNSVKIAESQFYAWSKDYWINADPMERDEAIMKALNVNTMEEAIEIWQYADAENIKQKGILLDSGEGQDTSELTKSGGNTENEYEFSNARLQSQVKRIKEFQKMTNEQKNAVIRELYDNLK